MPQALFALASCSKAFLVTSIGLLMEDYAHGRNVTPLPSTVEVFDWDTKMNDLLPGEWALEDQWASAKTNLRDAFGHITGLPRFVCFEVPAMITNRINTHQLH